MLGFIMNSCSNSSNDSTKTAYPVAIKMTDAPGPYDKVMIDLQGVEITGSTGQAVTLSVKKGIYNLLDFSNGVSTLIATDTLDDAKVEQIRLILGTNNTVVIKGVSYPLSTPSADQTGLKLQVHQTLHGGVLYSILLDFDANKSVIETGNGVYKLKPVIRTIETAVGGSIKGSITFTSTGLPAFVTVVDNSTNLSYSTNVNATGNFLAAGLPAGTYTVTVTPTLPALPVIKTNVVVTTGLTTDIGIVTIL